MNNAPSWADILCELFALAILALVVWLIIMGGRG